MKLEDINKILKEAETAKNRANSKTTAYEDFLIAEKLYNQVYQLCIKSKEIDEVKRDILSSVYQFEAFDCRHAYQIKDKDFGEARKTNSEQKQIVERILANYNEEELADSQLKNLYKDFRDKRCTIELQALTGIAKKFKEEENYLEALYYYRRAEDALRRVNISKLEGLFLESYNKNYHIIRFNISQCQLGVYFQESEKDQALEKAMIKSLLFGINETQKLLSIGGPDNTYEDGIKRMKSGIEKVLKRTDVSWKDLLEQNKSDPLLQEIMKFANNQKYILTYSTPITDAAKEDRFLFYTHGFNTRGKWKEYFTQAVSENERKTTIHFILRPWDYGVFVFQFFLPWRRKRIIEKFYFEYQRIADRYGPEIKKCLVAHSFGTYITSIGLVKHPDVKFERIIYAGNIIKVDFDWDYIKVSHQCEKVLIEKSTDDFAVFFGQIYGLLPWTKWIGAAGRKGFNREYDFVEVVESKSGHSGMINETNFSGKWLDFLIS